MSLILQETEKHIGNLERALSRLLNVEAQDQGQGILWRKGDSWFPATLDDLQNDFARQQREIFHQSSQGRRCYNMLHDIQDEILNLSSDSRNMAFLPLNASGDSNKNTRDVATCTTRRHRVSKARCRLETERACQRILSTYNTGDVVSAIIPTSTATNASGQPPGLSDQPQAVPTTPVTPQGSVTATRTTGVFTPIESITGTTIKLQKLGNMFVTTEPRSYQETKEFPFRGLSGLERMVLKQQHEIDQLQSVQEVPAMMSPNKVFGIAHNDVMMSQECETLEAAHPVVHQLPVPATSHKRTLGSEHNVPSLSNVCKKLDFNEPPPELLFDSEATDLCIDDTAPCFSPVASSSNTVFTPLKSVTQETAGLTPQKPETVTFDSCHTLTPVKVSAEPYMSDAGLFSPNSAWALGSGVDARVPQGGLSDIETLADIDDEHNLLCMESFDLDDVADQPLHDKTPQKLPSSAEAKHVCKKRSACKKTCNSGRTDSKHGNLCKRRRPKCRKRLEGLFEKSSEELSGYPVITGIFEGSADWSDFDGYLLYYQQVAPGLKKQLGNSHDAHSLAAIVSNMWSRLPSDDRSTMVTLAALENQDSNSSGSGSLSQDLEELNVTPIADKELGY